MADETTYPLNCSDSSANLKLDHSVTKLSQVSDARKAALASLGIKNIRDLINFFPRDYIDLSSVNTILDAKIGFSYTIYGTVYSIEEKEPKPGFKLIEITVTDKTGTLIATAFNQKWLLGSVHAQDKIAIAGKVEFSYGFKRIKNPFIYVLDENSNEQDIAKIIPIYTANENISSSWIRRIINNAFEYLGNINSIIPSNLVEKYKLQDYFDALKKCHFPVDMKQLAIAKRTIKYTQVLMQQLNVISKNINRQSNFITCEFIADKISKACEAMALYKDSGKQSLMFVPNSILMSQYKKLFLNTLKSFHITLQIIDEYSSKENKWKATYDFNNGDCDVLLGTSAILNLDINLENLGLIIVDEKTDYKFDDIRAIDNFEPNSDRLFLSSKPITKTMAKLIYPESNYLKVGYSKINNCEIKIFNKDDIAIAYDQCIKQTYNNEQILIVCPLVGIDHDKRNKMAENNNPDINIKISGDNDNYNLVSLEHNKVVEEDNSFVAKNKFAYLENQIFQESNCALIFDNMSGKEKLQILEKFENGKIQVLVCACNTNFLVKAKESLSVLVEDADRIGLSALHQIRNFIFESYDNSTLYLVSASKQKQAVKRLNFMQEIVDGESLVEKDLTMRREGSSLGLKNFGFDKLKLINIVRDKAIIETANLDARKIVEKDLQFKDKNHKLLSYEISRTYKN